MNTIGINHNQEGSMLLTIFLAIGFGVGSVDLHAVLNTEDGMSHNKRRTEEI